MSLLFMMYWMESSPSGMIVSACFQSGCFTLVRITLYFGAPECVTA